MKYRLLLLSIICLACVNRIDEYQLVGQWKVSELLVDAPKLSPMLIEVARQDAISTSYTLNDDKSFVEASNSKSNGEEGFWRFRKEDNQL